MPRVVRVVCGLAVVVGVLGEVRPAEAQWRRYPRGYGRYGWGGFAQDPASGYMAGLGSFARGEGAYEVQHAQAQSLNEQTAVRWNQELRARQQELQAERAKKAARDRVATDARLVRDYLENGTTLNQLLYRIASFDPLAIRAARVGAPLSAQAIREIPFEWDSEAISLCLDQMLGRGELPESLASEELAPERQALSKAVQKAIAEDRTGDVSPAAAKAVSSAVNALHAKYESKVSTLEPSYSDGEVVLTTLGSLTRLLNDPGMKKALAELEQMKEVSVGKLVAFMQAFNLRFGPATTPDQVALYAELGRLLPQVLEQLSKSPPPDAPPSASKSDMPSAAREAFKGMNWKDLEAHSRSK